LLAFGTIAAQTNPKFNVSLSLDYSAAARSIELYQDQFVNTQELAALRGNRIAAATTGLIADRQSVPALLKNYLDSLQYHQIITDDVYHLEDARTNVADIKQLLEAMQRQNFNQRVVATVEQIFPTDAEVNLTIPVYVVALGHENVDAYVRRIVWHDDAPEFVGENEGELTIVVNLARSVTYGQTVQERFVSLLGVVAHEVFHAAFGAYKDQSPVWKRFYENHQRPFDALLDLTQNEGIAYYLSLDQQGGGRLPMGWFNHTQEVFVRFNRNAGELLSKTLTPDRANKLIRTANLSGYWQSYGAMTGMFIAREIDLQLGRSALIETIARGPIDMFSKYINLTERDSNLPKLSPTVTQEILKNP
jgi:hypothetical protein